MIVKIIGMALLTLCCALFLKRIDPFVATVVSVGCSVVILAVSIVNTENFISYYYDLCNDRGYGEYFGVMLKGLGVAFLTQTGSDICKDSGENLLASRIELAGKIEILAITLPLIKSLVALSENILTK